ncbi:MAG TPA: hypothetical protein PKC18_01470 [Lacipirellulaceae bacterium]|nr:hypothetical protein [Lacipirellulaceae bacterium]
MPWYHEHRQEFDAEMAADAERDEAAARQCAGGNRKPGPLPPDPPVAY